VNGEYQDKGTYILVITLAETQKIKPGKLPEAIYRKGTYLYVGRAKKGLKARIKRHLRNSKNLHWHVDYLLLKAEIADIWIRPNFFGECSTASAIQRFLPSPAASPRGFGSSDCRCPGHLFYFPPGTKGLKSLRKKTGFVKAGSDGNNL
jgi:Uri superfamily endonuclease